MYMSIMFRWHLSSLVIWSSSKQVMKEFRVIGIIVKANSVAKDVKYVFTEDFMMQSLVEVCHDERRL